MATIGGYVGAGRVQLHYWVLQDGCKDSIVFALARQFSSGQEVDVMSEVVTLGKQYLDDWKKQKTNSRVLYRIVTSSIV